MTYEHYDDGLQSVKRFYYKHGRKRRRIPGAAEVKLSILYGMRYVFQNEPNSRLSKSIRRRIRKYRRMVETRRAQGR